MINIFDILKNIVLNEAVNRGELESAIKKRHRVALTYEGDPSHGVASGMRYVDPYSLIETTAGNLAIRGYQPFGDTVSQVPSWKLFRVDRITNWVETPLTFKQPAQGWNPNGDAKASRVLLSVQFGDKVNKQFNQPTQSEPTPTPNNVQQPRNNNVVPQPNVPNNKQSNNNNNTNINQDSLYKTDTEKNMDRLKQQVDKPVYIDDYMKQQNQQSDNNIEDDENNNIEDKNNINK